MFFTILSSFFPYTFNSSIYFKRVRKIGKYWYSNVLIFVRLLPSNKYDAEILTQLLITPINVGVLLPTAFVVQSAEIRRFALRQAGNWIREVAYSVIKVMEKPKLNIVHPV